MPAGDEAALRGMLLSMLAAATGREPEQVDVDTPFSALGLDSAKLAALGSELESALGGPIDLTVLFEFPTAAALAARLAAPVAAPSAVPRAGAGDPGEPVAIVGIGCRLPGAVGPDAFWRLLEDGVDAVTEVPAGRWDVADVYDPDPAAPGRSLSRWGGFLDDPAAFDARFFRISAEEALRMDPQQRLLLEVCWEALEDAGEVPARLRGSRTGVYVGISVDDYAQRQLADREAIGPHVPTGNSLAVAANRLSYVFDLRGPSMAVDTACSSSLVAVHLACRALRSGECELAVAGGVNLVLDPEITVGLSKAGMMAPDGRCKAFDARADGYVRGEGCALVVLRPLRAALAAGDRVYAVIRGSAVNQDGASNGLTAPNPTAQRAVLLAAYRDAAVDPSAVGYVECHGTGTLLGDPIEARSLGAVVGAGRPAGSPCLIGSVKTNIGHLEAAAGAAGLVKVALALHRCRLPGSLHFVEPNPHIPFADLGLAVATGGRDWPAGGRLAGVSGFGFGGTNAHVVLEEAPAAAPLAVSDGPLAVAVSARSADALERLLGRWAEQLERAGASEAVALAHTANARRTQHRPYRAALVAAEASGLAARARALAGTLVRPAAPSPPRVGFVFTGQGSQWPGMAAGLQHANPLFRSTIRRCDEAAFDALGWSIEDVLAGRDGRDLDDTAVAQPVLVAVQVGLAAVWRSLGIEPAGVAGHSVGEISAAIVAGALDLASGMCLAVLRGRLMAAPEGRGRMLAVGLSELEARRLAGPSVSLAAVNGPDATVLAGEADALEAVRRRLDGAGKFARWLDVAYAFHSPRMGPAADALAAELAGLSSGAAAVPLYSTVLGRRARDGELDAAHWARGVREPVEMAAAVTAMLGDGVEALLEVGPRPALGGALRSLVRAAGRDEVAVLASLREDRDDRLSLLESAGRLWALGSPVRWQALTPAGPVASVPAHPWDHERFWLERPRPRAAPAAGGDPLLGTRLDLAPVDGRAAWELTLGERSLPELRDHVVGGTPIVPGVAFVDLAIRAAAELGMAGPLRVDGLRLHLPLPLVAGTRVQTSLVPAGGGGHDLAVHSRPPGGDAWRLHARARVATGGDAPAVPDLAGAAIRCLEPVPVDGLYGLLAAGGLAYGPAFRGVREAWRGAGEATGRVAVDGTATADLRALDAALHLIAAAAGPGAAAGPTVPVAAERFWWGGPPVTAHRAHVKVRETAGGLLADITMLDGDDRVIVAIRGLELRGGAASAPAEGSLRVYEPVWREARTAARAVPSGRWLVLGGAGIARDLAGDVVTCRPGGAYALSDGEVAIDPHDPGHYRRLLAASAPLAGVVHLWGLEEGDGPGRAGLAATTLLLLVQALSDAPPARLVVATRGSQPVTGAVSDPQGGAVWGLLKTLPLENPLLDFVAVDLDPDGDQVAPLVAEMVGTGADREVGYRGGRRYVRRLAETGTAGGRPEPAPLRGQGTYVITGGTGGLGRALASRLVERGATHVALVARRAAPAAEPIRVVTADVAERGELARALDEIRSWGAPIRGVVHAAGILDDRAMLDMPADSLDRVMRPKVAGAWHLHELTVDDPLDWFVLFASAAGILGSPGQANYAAANAYLDALAHRRRALGRPGLAIDWGPWADAGMAADRAEGQRLRTAVSAIAPGEGLAALEALTAAGPAQAVVLPFDLRDLLQFYPTQSGMSFFDEIASDDVRALKTIGVPASARPELSDEYVAPRTDTERRIVAIWQRSLGIEPIGVLDRFFELGGDSVFANQILLEVKRSLGVTVDGQAAFEDFTVARLAALADAAGAPAAAPVIRPVAAAPSAPASLFQEEVWASQRGVRSTAPFTISFAAFVDAGLDAGALESAVAGIAARHRTLRTTFFEEDGELRQRVSDGAAPRFRHEDLSALPADEADAAAVAAATDLARGQLDLGSGPLAAVTLARVRPGRHLLAVMAHHLVADGWSLNVALGELSALYEGFRTGVPPALPELPVQYGDFAVWQREWLQRGEWRPHVEHWRATLAGLRAPRFPSAPSGERTTVAGQVPLRLSPELSAALRRLARAEDATVFMALLTALAILIHEETGATDVPIGTPTAGRRHAETHPLIGLFTSYVVLRADLGGDPPFRDLLRQVRATALAAYANDEVDTSLYLREVEPGRTEPLYRSTLVLQPRRRVLTFAGATLDAFQLDPGQGLSDLSLYAWDEEPSIWGRLKFLEDVYDQAGGERLAMRLLEVLEAAAADPRRRLSALR